MEVYLKDADNNVFRFPIVPSVINIQDYAIMNESNITAKGDIIVFGGKGLRTTEISSFFPNPERKYSFVNYSGYPKQYECVSKIKKWMDKGTKLRFIVTDTEINFLVKITTFEYSEQDGTRDVYYKLGLKEYREITIPGIKNTNKEISSKVDNTTRPSNTTSNKTTQKTHTVKSGDTLYDIAKKYYGKGSDYTKIQKVNNTKYPSLKKNTIIEVGWKLIIP